MVTFLKKTPPGFQGLPYNVQNKHTAMTFPYEILIG